MSYRVFSRDDGLHYEGLGRGVFTDTSFYEGEWQRGFPHGYGVFSAADGSKFAGEWREEQLHGLAVLTNRLKGRQYEGEYVNGKCDGYGVFAVSSGERYAGHWCRDSYDGLGRFYSRDGTSKEGVWKCDELVEIADASDAVGRAELAVKNAQKAAKIADEKSIEALDAAEIARQEQEAADAAELSASILEGRAYRALYQYDARSEDEASVEEGDIIINAESVDDPLWFRGQVQRTGQMGLIPLEYVEQIVSEE